MSVRVLSPATGGKCNNVFGRDYSSYPAGTVLDVPEGDAEVLVSNGWSRPAIMCGTTAVRNALDMRGVITNGIQARFYDVTLGLLVAWDGANWRKFSDGTVV